MPASHEAPPSSGLDLPGDFLPFQERGAGCFDSGTNGEQSFAKRITPENNFQFRDPFPLSENCFLTAVGSSVFVMDGTGRTERIYALPEGDAKAGVQCHEPRPLRPHPRERVIPSRVDLAQTTGRLILADVAYGRNMGGVEPGQIKKLLVLEPLPMPVHFQGGMRPITNGGSFTLERILGTIPVEPDGSAYAELPALRSLFFVALDEKDLSVKRMQSFLTVQPGETVSCAGCHESRTRTPPLTPASRLQALSRPPSRIEPIEGVAEVIDYPRDIQPILDRHCLECHDSDKRSGGVDLSGDRGPMFSHSYFTLVSRRQVADGRNQERGNRPPRTIGSSASPLMRKIDGRHHEVILPEVERNRIRLWIESGAAYPGTYAALATGSIGDVIWKDSIRLDMNLPSVIEAAKVIQQRCAQCHKGPTALSPMPSAGLGLPSPFSGHALYDLTRPEKSLILMAPLARQAGGFGMRKSGGPASGQAEEAIEVFADAADPNYQKILAAIRDCKAILDRIKRFDMPGFRPREEYIREMKRYGILPQDLGPNDPIDVYAAEAAYWRSFWPKPIAP